ncbi:MAG: energy transducer TonB [Bacteroidales bacterium]|nr:energy transducer TonB [Bacteroidales bacterium]MDE6237473.1 energy transducer TonB [Muribaculaceae bacterium]MDE6866024.1 energy transducer TonB [Muribaculaceae bacterium]
MKKILTLAMIVMASVSSLFTIKAAAETTSPSYPGGETAMTSFIAANLHYPEYAKENGIEGVIPVGFVVKKDGTLADVKVLRYLDPDMEAEAIRVVTLMPKWTPALQDGTPIDAPATVEIKFINE